ncbi:MAG: tRNA pseudouridine(55) synthase TruB [Acidimicrobiia bacterium]
MRGFLAIDKPTGPTSHDVVDAVRRVTGVRKVGHAGTLDPMATGLLVVAVGPVTRLIRYVQAGRKAYVADVAFGIATDSLDADGTEVDRVPMPDLTAEDVEAVLDDFVGRIDQVPPMVSALKRGGVRLHELARRGEEVEREPRPVDVHELDLVSFAPGEFPTARLRVVCGPGTYVRVLADDLARAVGGRAHLTALRRTAIGSLHVDRAVRLDELAPDTVADHLLAPAAALADLPTVVVDDVTAAGVANGRTLEGSTAKGPIAVMDESGALLAVYRAEGTRLVPDTVLPR